MSFPPFPLAGLHALLLRPQGEGTQAGIPHPVHQLHSGHITRNRSFPTLVVEGKTIHFRPCHPRNHVMCSSEGQLPFNPCFVHEALSRFYVSCQRFANSLLAHGSQHPRNRFPGKMLFRRPNRVGNQGGEALTTLTCSSFRVCPVGKLWRPTATGLCCLGCFTHQRCPYGSI